MPALSELTISCEDENKKKCFTFTWTIENVTYAFQEEEKSIESPTFTVDDLPETNWKLELNFTNDDKIGLYLVRQENESQENIDLTCEFAFLSSNNKVLHVFKRSNLLIDEDGYEGESRFASRNEVFFEKRSMFLSQDTLTARCRIWKSDGEMSKDVQLFARTRIVVEKRTFMWCIKNFDALDKKQRYEIKSVDTGEKLMTLELFLTGGLILDEMIRFKIIPNFQNIKISTFRACIVDVSKNETKCFQDEFWVQDAYDSKEFLLFFTRRELIKQKSLYLPNNILSLRCECAFSLGVMLEEINMVHSDSTAVKKTKLEDHCSKKRSELPFPKNILIEEFKSLLNNNDSLSDIKLKTNCKTYPAHKCILSARSPVFKAMFSNDMKEKIKDYVDMEGLKDDIVLDMLRFIYTAEIEDLEWNRAIELYEAADRYGINDLRDICSSYLKSSLCLNQACEILILADQHKDEDLKGFAQDFILRNGKNIISSKKWDQLMETHLKLAAETMRLKFTE